MTSTLRSITRADFPDIWRVRYAVRENTLRSGLIDDEDLRRETEDTGHGWVVEVVGVIQGFAIGNAQTGNIWALFIDPSVEGRGYAKRLHAAMVEWLFVQGLERLHLSTDPNSRAADFYRRQGWQPCGLTDKGELRFELLRSSWALG